MAKIIDKFIEHLLWDSTVQGDLLCYLELYVTFQFSQFLYQ